MMRRLWALCSTGALFAATFVAVATLGASAAHAASFGDWASISAGDNHTCGVRANGKLYCWGSDDFGQVGDGNGTSITPVVAPRRVGDFEDWATVAAGGTHTCGVRSNGKLYCWGSDSYGQIGDGSTASGYSSPRRIGSSEDWTAVSAAYRHTCAIRHGGKLYCWGNNDSDQVGSGDDSPVISPKLIGAFEDWERVDTGGYHTCAIRHGGKLYCWGRDDYGQVGNGDGDGYDVTSYPRRVGSFEDWSRVASGLLHTCGVRKNGKLYCWGLNNYGQVGDDNPDPAIAPRRIGSFEDWSRIAAGDNHTCGVRKNGKLYCWGLDGSGQVGDGDGTGATTPRRIGTDEDWTTATGGEKHSCGIRHSGDLYCWGNDDSGQIGDGGDDFLDLAPRHI